MSIILNQGKQEQALQGWSPRKRGPSLSSLSSIFIATLLLVFIALSPQLKASGDLYDFLWLDPDKKVYVLQNKVYEKKRRTYFNLSYISGQSSSFFKSRGIGGLVGHYLTEEISVEVFYNKYSNSKTETYENLVRINGVEPFSRQINQNLGVMALWSPFYGKVNTFNKIFYFDWSLSLGVGQIKTQSNANTAADPDTPNVLEDESYTSFNAKTGVRFHATRNVHLGIDYQRSHFRAPGVKFEDRPQETKWRSHSDIVFSIGFSF